jgi:hypothetical protein
VTATDGDKDRPQNIVYFLTGQGIDPDNPANSKFDINRTTGEIFVLKVSKSKHTKFSFISACFKKLSREKEKLFIFEAVVSFEYFF